MKSPVQYLIADKSLGMSAGKLAAQVAHGAVRSAMHSGALDTDKWLKNGETKIVLEARDAGHLRNAQTYIESRGYKTFLVIDEGRTEVPPLSATVLAVELVDKADDHVKMTFETFKTYKPEPSTVQVLYPEPVSDKPKHWFYRRTFKV
jgi:PTH2 family peptidyl-tRNA hydrolase